MSDSHFPLLLVRQGIPVTLLEAHKDFDREFRGDTVHPSTLEILDEIGLAERLHQLRHVKVFAPILRVGGSSFTPLDFRRLNTRFPYIMLMHQPIFLEFVTEEAAKYPNFRLVMRANVMALVEEGGEVRGVRYQSPQGWHEVRALLTVGADGRFSRVRQQAGFVPIKTSPPMDVLWFRLPRLPEDPPVTGGGTGGVRRGHIFAVLDPMGVASQIVEHMLGSAERRLGVDDPLLPERDRARTGMDSVLPITLATPLLALLLVSTPARRRNPGCLRPLRWKSKAVADLRPFSRSRRTTGGK